MSVSLAAKALIPSFLSGVHEDRVEYLADMAKEAERVACAVPLTEGEHFTRARKHIRDKLVDTRIAKRIDDLVASLLG